MVDAVTMPSEEEIAETPGNGAATDGRLRWASALRLARRELFAALNGLPIYLMISLACLVAALLIKSYLDYVSANGTLVLANAFHAPILFAVLVSNGVLCLAAAAGLGGERERGTLEVLFYGPVDSKAYITGKLLGHLAVYVVVLVALLVFLVAASALTGMGLDTNGLLLLVSSLLPAASMIALGLLLAALVGRQRAAVALTALVLILFLMVDIGNQFVAAQPADTALGSAAGMVAQISAVVEWISPFGYIWRAAESFSLQDTTGVLLRLGSALLYGLLLTALAIVTLTKRGVERWRE